MMQVFCVKLLFERKKKANISVNDERYNFRKNLGNTLKNDGYCNIIYTMIDSVRYS